LHLGAHRITHWCVVGSHAIPVSWSDDCAGQHTDGVAACGRRADSLSAHFQCRCPGAIAVTRETLYGLNEEYRDQLTLLGVSTTTRLKTLLWEGRYGLLTALLAGFGRAIAEVGAVIIVGGNINHVTRVMTTTIALETSRGNLALALGLGIVLVGIALLVNLLVLLLGGSFKYQSGHRRSLV